MYIKPTQVEVDQATNIIRDTFLANLSYKDYDYLMKEGDIRKVEEALALAVQAFQVWGASIKRNRSEFARWADEFWSSVDVVEMPNDER